MANGNDMTAKLLDLKKKIDAAKQERSKLEGNLETYQAELKKLGIDDDDKAQEILSALDADIAAKKKDRDKKYKELSDALQ